MCCDIVMFKREIILNPLLREIRGNGRACEGDDSDFSLSLAIALVRIQLKMYGFN